MKKIFCILSLALFAAASSLFAAKGGFVDPAKGGKGVLESEVSTVAQAKAMSDDAMVLLRGFIIEQIGDEKYRFKDETSEETIVIEVDDDDWKGLKVMPNDLILIYGEIDKGLLSAAEVDVKEVRKVKGASLARRGQKAAAPACTDCPCGTAAQKK